ncbi:MAG: transcriptional repressor [Thermodesulfobacteriota bacterium]
MEHSETFIRVTKQRRVILEELDKCKVHHPSANDVYDMVRRRLPRIGLGTVYRNLELMADSGMINKLANGANQNRFDPDMKPHYHIRCPKCDRLENVNMPVFDEIQQPVADATHFQVESHSIEFKGLCPECQNEQ